jgi:N-acetylglutamate synthase-like GNAT family acetyltransferase
MSLGWENFMVAVDERDALVGCGQEKTHEDGSRELASIAVVQRWRRHGVASHIVRELQARHGPPLWLTCRSRLTAFYEGFGFSEVTQHANLPPYFRKILRVARMFHWMAPGERLAVMVWDRASVPP